MKTVFKVMVLAVLASCSRNGSDNVKYSVDQDKSAVEWKGSAPTHYHEGAFRVVGDLKLNGQNKIVEGNFTIPIASITNFDLEDEVIRQQLLDHLKSPDFFNIALHPNAGFKITKVEEYTGGSELNAKITGEFTMIGKTQIINFPAKLNITNDKITVDAVFTINRLEFGMNSYNDPNEGLYILPEVDITLKIVCNRS